MAETNEDGLPKACFLTAPALETVFAVQALAHPQKRPFAAAWASEVEQRLTAQEQQWLAALRQLPELFGLGDLLLAPRCFQDVTLVAEHIRAMAPDDFAAFLLDNQVPPAQVAAFRHDPDGPVQLRKQFPWLWGGDVAVLDAIIRRPEALRDAWAGLLLRVWEIGVQPMLPKLEPLWQATLSQAEAEAAGRHPRDFAFQVFGKLFARRYGPDYIFPEYLFVPTYFLSPTKAALFRHDVALVTLDCRLGPWAIAKARGEVALGLRAIAEENRLEMLRLLTQTKGFGGWVAGRLKLNPATVNHHMNQLRRAGLLREEEGPPGAAKYYSTDREALGRLIKLLQDYLDGNLEPDWNGDSA